MIDTEDGFQPSHTRGAGLSNDEIGISVDVRFAMVPLWVTECELITDRALRLYVVLRQHADNATGTSWCKRKTLAAECRWSVKTLDRALRELVAAGAVTVRARWKSAGPNPSYSFEQSATHPEQTSSLYTVRSLPPAVPSRGGDKSVPTPSVDPEGGGDKSVPRGRDTFVPGVGTDLTPKLEPRELDPEEPEEGGCVSGVRHQASAPPVDNPTPIPATAADPDEPPVPWCPDHPGNPGDVPCGRCKANRLQRKAWEERAAHARAAADREQLAAKHRADTAAITACGMCDNDGFIEPTVKCLHDPEAIEIARRGAQAVRAALANRPRRFTVAAARHAPKTRTRKPAPA